MTFDNIDLYSQIIGSIIKDPVVLSSIPSPIVMDDFAQEGGSPARVIFFAISNLIDRGVVKLDITVIETYLQDYLSLNQTYNRNHGREFLYMAMDKGEPENFSAYYSQLKKNSLLRDLKEHGYDISPYDVEACEPNTKEEMDCITRYEEATEDDILSYVERSLSVIRSRHSATQGSFITAADGLREYLEELERAPEIGPPLCGLAYNSIVRGALRGKLYLRSAGSNVGKTRISVFDACNIVFPIHWWPGGKDDNGEMLPPGFVYENNKVPQKVLFITTEMKEKEIQSIILSYVSGVENSKILYNGCNESEKERIKDAIQIIEKYKDYFYLERIQDPNLTNVQSTIKKHILLHDVGYVFYDYIFSSPSLISQFVGNGIREDVALMMLSNQLKEIAATYNVFISTSTQVNGDGLRPEEKRDQRVLRGSKAIADGVFRTIKIIIVVLFPRRLEK